MFFGAVVVVVAEDADDIDGDKDLPLLLTPSLLLVDLGFFLASSGATEAGSETDFFIEDAVASFELAAAWALGRL